MEIKSNELEKYIFTGCKTNRKFKAKKYILKSLKRVRRRNFY